MESKNEDYFEKLESLEGLESGLGWVVGKFNLKEESDRISRPLIGRGARKRHITEKAKTAEKRK